MNITRSKTVLTAFIACALLGLTFVSGLETASAIVGIDACSYINGHTADMTNATPGSGYVGLPLTFVGDEVISAHVSWYSGALPNFFDLAIAGGQSVIAVVPASSVIDTSITAVAAGVQLVTVRNDSASTGDISWILSCSHGIPGGSLKPLFTDGRINQDAGQSAAVYCNQGGVIIYAVYKGVGYFAFSVSKAELDAVPAMPAVNTLIKQALGVRLYRLTSGQLQINAATSQPGKEYKFVWQGC